VLISLAIQGGFCYLFEYFSAGFALGRQSMAGVPGSSPLVKAGNDSAPIGTMVHNITNVMFGGGGAAVSVVVAVTVLLALLGTTLACLNTGVRVTYAMARDREMPSVLGLLHGRYATPHGGIVVLTAVSALIGIYGVHNVDNLTQITLASNIGTFLVYGMTCLVAVVAFASRHDRQVVKHLALPGLGLVMNVAELLGVVYLAVASGGSSSTDALKAIGVVVAWAVIGVVWAVANPRRRDAQAVVEGRRSRPPAGVTA